jgi:5-(carboxyamino)imidazole ribonucleotide synthase
MLALAGVPLGLRTCILDPGTNPCATVVAEHIHAEYDDSAALEALARCSDVITYEFENVPVSAVNALLATVPIRPGARSLEVLQDRLTEKQLFRTLGIPVPGFEPVDSLAELHAAVKRIGTPAVVKTRRFGYDGKNQMLIRKPADVDEAWERLHGHDLIVEQFIDFEREVAIIGVRSLTGDHAFYRVVESHHVEGILRWLVPLDDAGLQRQAEQYAGALLDALDHVGALGFEFFQTAEGLLANEAAPRVHNTGHWTIDGARTSQFENHMRAITGLPLGDTRTTGYVGNVNFIGSVPEAAEVLAVPGAHHHDYSKAPRAGRKVGHATVIADDPVTRDESLGQLRELAAAAESEFLYRPDQAPGGQEQRQGLQ